MAGSTALLGLGATSFIGQILGGSMEGENLRNMGASAVESAKAYKAISERQALIARTTGRIESDEIRRSDKRMIARTVAGISASGVQGSGSPTDLIADQIAESGYRQSKAVASAELKAENFELTGAIQERNALLQARSLYDRADAAELGGIIGGTTSLLGAYAKAETLGGGFFG